MSILLIQVNIVHFCYKLIMFFKSISCIFLRVHMLYMAMFAARLNNPKIRLPEQFLRIIWRQQDRTRPPLQFCSKTDGPGSIYPFSILFGLEPFCLDRVSFNLILDNPFRGTEQSGGLTLVSPCILQGIYD